VRIYDLRSFFELLLEASMSFRKEVDLKIQDFQLDSRLRKEEPDRNFVTFPRFPKLLAGLPLQDFRKFVRFLQKKLVFIDVIPEE